MVNPRLTGGDPDMFMAGNDLEAKMLVRKLIEGFGWKRVIDLGDIENARWMEALSMLWVVYSNLTGKIARAAGLELSAHVLRHTCITKLVRRGSDVVLVAELAGHRRLETTRRYSLPSDADRQLAMDGLEIED